MKINSLINQLLSPLIILITLAFFTFSCQKSNKVTTVHWSKGDSIADLKKLSDVKTNAPTSEVFYKNNKIQFTQQTINDIPVANTFIKKQNDDTDQLIALSAVIVENPTSTTKQIFKKKSNSHFDEIKNLQILNNLNQFYKIKNYTSQKKLQIKNNEHTIINTIEYELSDGTIWLASFDESTLLSNEKLGSNLNEVTTNLYLLGPKLSALTDFKLFNVESTPSVSNQSVFVDSESTSKINLVTPLLKFNPKDERFDQMQVFYYLDKVLNWMKTRLSVRFPQRIEAVVNVGYPEKTNTAFYYNNKIRLGRGDDITFSMIASDPSIVYHEAFHSLIDGIAKLPFQGEGGSLNEGFADFLTCVALGRPYLGESSYLKAPYKRTLIIQTKLQEKNAGLYHDSQILSGLLWELKEKIGEEKALQLAMETLVQLTPASDFESFNTIFVKVINQFLNSDEIAIAHSILQSRGFKYE